MNPRDAARQALATLEAVGGDLPKAMELAKSAINPNTPSDSEFIFRCDVYEILTGRGGYEC